VRARGRDLVEDGLLRWRRRALVAVLGLVVVTGLPSYVLTFWNAVQRGEVTPLLFVYAAAYLAFVALVAYPRLKFSLRAWLFILLAYANGAASLARLGLVGSGRLYLITMPVIATMVVGARAGYLTAGLSLAIYIAFTWLAHTGLLAGLAVPPEDPTTLRYWSEAGAALAVFLVLLVALVERFHGLQLRALAARRKAIAELERAGTALKEREERLALVTQGINDGIWDWDLKTDQVYFSPRWKAMLGYQEEEIPHRFEAWRDLVHPEDLRRAEAAIRAHLDGGSPIYHLEHRLRHKDGTYRWILARGICLRDATGQPYRMAGSHTDITERKGAEEALRSSEAEMRALLAAMTDVMFVLDRHGRYLKIPPTNPELLYRPPAELLGKTLHEVFPRSQADLFLANIRRALSTRQPVRFEYFLPIGGASIWFDATVSPMMEDTVVWVARDISERKKIEQALQTAYQDMEQRVAERTHELVTLNSIAALVNRSLDLQEILNDALAKTMEVLDLEGGGAYSLEDNGETLLLLAQRGLSDTLLQHTTRLSLQTTLAGHPIAPDQPIVWQVADYPVAEIKCFLEDEGIQVVVGLPLMVKSSLLGGLILHTHRPRILRTEELSLLVAVGQQVALAVENARLYRREHEGHEGLSGDSRWPKDSIRPSRC
jgi:PAS domain S-box-containing protein